MSKHLPLHGLELVLHSDGHMGTRNGVQQYDAVTGLNWTFVLHLDVQL
jgi:hypothetical protein